MQKIMSALTVYFEDPFWIGLYESIDNGQVRAFKITFGPEPKDYEVYQYLQAHFYHFAMSPPVPLVKKPKSSMNPKKMKKKIHQLMTGKKQGTKAQEAIKLQISCTKDERKKQKRLRKEEDKVLQYQLRQKKKKEKHRGH